MKKISYFFTMLILVGFTLSCKKDIEKDKGNDKGNDSVVNFGMKDVKIILPDGSNYDLTGHEVMAGGVIKPVSKDGKSEVPDIKGSSNIAYLFNKDNNVVMAGFITDSTATISTESTAKVILFFATSAAFSLDTIAKMFISKIGTVPLAAAWIQNFSATWKANPLTFSQGTYMSSLNAMLKEAIGAPVKVDIRSRTSEVDVDAADIRSGIQVFEDGLGQFSIHNNYRRRAYAFIYKSQFKIEGSKTYTDITPATLYKELPIDATSGVTSTVGAVIGFGIGKGLDVGITKNGPVTLELNDNESEAVYKVRVIGVGMDSPPMTVAEATKKDRLLIETFTLDFLMPAIAWGIGSLDKEQKGAFVEATDQLVKITPGVYDELNKGNFVGALTSVLKSLAETAQGDNLKNLITSIIKYKLKDPEAAAKKSAQILFAIDGILQGSDFIRIGYDIHASRQLEEWKVVARSSKISLDPREKVVIQNSQESFEVTIKNLGNDESNISYEWNTLGKYGKISDSKGHSGTVFTSTDKKINYRANAGGTLSDGDNWEYIYVKALQAGKEIGSDTAKVNVKKNKHLMKPDGITLTGKKGKIEEHYANEAALHLELPNNEVILKPNAFVDYKIIWTTEGRYGKLLDARDVYSNTLTTYDDNMMWYECQDEKAINKVETIKARIYSKHKNEPESEYKLFDEVTGSINIDNDPKKKILHYPVFLLHGDTTFMVGTQQGYNCFKAWAATFPEDKDAKSYTIKFYGGKNAMDQSYNWVAGAPTPAPPANYAGKGYSGGVFTITWLGTVNSRAGPFPGHANASPPSGAAQVTVYLK